MTEAEWLASKDATLMLRVVQGKGGPGRRLWPCRKERLFACACFRRIADLLSARELELLELSERYADGAMNRNGFLDALMRHYGVSGRPKAADLKHSLITHLGKHGIRNCGAPYHAADLLPGMAALNARFTLSHRLNQQGETSGQAGQGARPELPPSWRASRAKPVPTQAEADAQAELVRDVFGNPFRPAPFDPAWRTADALRVAGAVYAERAFDRLPILADALEEAGCVSEEVLRHCREPGEHARGCWVVDLVLGKE